MIVSSYQQSASCTPVPEDLANLRQFVGWKYGKKRENGKHEKIPINPHTGERASVDNRSTWGTLEQAIRCAIDKELEGIGFVFTKDDPFAGVDIDGCRNPKTSEIEGWAEKIIRRFNSYTEVSPSSTGVKIIVRGELPPGRKRRDPVEMYDRGRFFTLTSVVLGSRRAVEGRQKALEGLHRKMSSGDAQKATQPSRKAIPVDVADQELLKKARNAANGKKFRRLYDEGDASNYRSRSEADLALAGLLAFWTGRNRERITRLLRASALYRPKMDRQDYMEGTINLAVSRCERTYTPKPCAEGEVHRMLDAIEKLIERNPWTERSGPTDKHMVGGFLELARDYGKACPEGVVVAAAWRDLAPIAGVSSDATAKASIKRLMERGWIRLVEKGRGRRASKYLIPAASSKLAHKEQQASSSRLAHKETNNKKTPISTPPCVQYGPASSPAPPALKALLRKWRNPAPQVEAEFDKNGRKIPKEARHSKRPRGKGAAVIVEKVAAASPRVVTESELALVLERRPDNFRRDLRALVEDGFVLELEEGYVAPDDLLDRVLDELEETGCNQRERMQRGRYARDREGYEQYLRDKAAGKAPKDEPEGLVEDLKPVGEGVITDANNPEQFKTLAAVLRDGIKRSRENVESKPKTPRSRFVWPYDPEKAAFYFGEEADAA